MSNEEHEDTGLVKKLRAEIDRISAERDEFKSQVRSTVLGEAFQAYGLDPSTGAGRLAAQAYEGDLAPSAVSEWLDEQGFAAQESDDTSQPDPAGMDARADQRRKADRIFNDSTPASSAAPKMSVAEHQQLLKTDPQAAMKAAQEGRIEFSSPAAAAALNQQSNPSLGAA